MNTRPVIDIAPQAGPQEAYVNCPVFDVCYGGARGGGKTFGSLLDWILHERRYGNKARGLFIRRTLVDLIDVIEEARILFAPFGARWHGPGQGNEFRMRSGAVLRMRYLDNDNDAGHYQGHQYTRVYVEELTQFPSPAPVDKLKATVRSKYGVPGGFRSTCNPGGPGHTWVKSRYIDQGDRKVVLREFDNPFDGTKTTIDQVFIQARLSDNPILTTNDPGYVARLHLAGSAQLVRAWLMGDWNVIDGAFFDCWNPERHVVRPFALPDHWTRLASGDWGSASPFSFGWWAVASEETRAGLITIPRGCLVRYREWYGCKGGVGDEARADGEEQKPNVGLKLDARVVGEGLAKREALMPKVSRRVLDPAAFASDGGPSIAERILRSSGVVFQKADNRRVTLRGAMGGWDMMRERLVGEEDGNPMIVFFDTCVDSIRTIPVLQHDADRPEDLDTEGEDHAADDVRYCCMARPWARPRKIKRPEQRLMVGTGNTMTLDGFIAQARREGEDA